MGITTEPKDVRGGDEPLEANAPKASDPAPVREAVAWLEVNRLTGEIRVSLNRRADTPTMVRRWTTLPLGILPTRAPEARERVARIIDPQAFDHPDIHPQHLKRRREEAFAKADRLATPDPLPVSREAALQLFYEWLDERDIATVDGDEGLIDAILALTGETSRG